jgi:Uma2 family endonuclease
MWLVDIPGRRVEVGSDPDRGRYATVRRLGEGDVLSPVAFPDVTIAVADLFG